MMKNKAGMVERDWKASFARARAKPVVSRARFPQQPSRSRATGARGKCAWRAHRHHHDMAR